MAAARLRKILTLLCPALSSLFLALGYSHTGSGAAGVGIFTLLIWLAARHTKTSWIVTFGLLMSSTAAVFGLMMGKTLFWMLPATALALVSWDLILLEARLANNPPGAPAGPLETAHYISLGIALVTGLLVVFLGQMIRLRIPFIFMLALLVLAYFSLNWLFRSFAKGR